ncbi:hypothetical protein JCM9140_4620 [Halalkalibacter wakoensis JCM 9140]|uniref:YolD-like protein n=1 Tax=Halalkalibacter wakoensis JCM 9140 TaxID=1236970 RepID=W4Q8U5_9BACI|nr:YolD-like family protein [Halalkalibacter wakoensis]GAE28397.1 hypothetical protein JCM9140_4620 [Halalkalibacter wakoensis JCM 9140]
MNEQPLQRGNLLWESSRMFLPEHKEALLRRKQQLTRVPPPALDEQHLEEIGLVVLDSLKHELPVQITYWEDGFFHEVTGMIDRIDRQTKKVKIKVTTNEPLYLAMDCLKSVERL